jgi:aromatic-L-amino-acid/L-tryptophan decarboxylase
MIAGLADDPDDRTHVRLIEVDATFALRAEVLERQMLADVDAGLVPMFVCACIGTTSSTAIDPVPTIGAVIARVASRLGERGIAAPWLHVDAAHAGAMAVCPEYRGLLSGMEHADSYCFNPHKWLLVNFDCDCFWTRDRQSLTGSMSITPEYLRTQEGVTNFRDWHVPLGRRFRALKLWLVLRRYGLEALRAYVREHVQLAAWLEAQMRADARFEIVAPRTMNLVCFRLRDSDPERGDRRTRELLDMLNASGEMLLTPTVLPIGGASRTVGRVCIGSSTTRREHVEAMWTRIAAAAGRVARGG